MKLNALWLRILALILITIDHIALIFVSPFGTSEILYLVLRGIGRMGFPLFAFFIVEGVVKTKHLGKYLIRIAILLLTLTTAQVVMSFTPLENMIDISQSYNIFITLFVGATTVAYFHRRKFKEIYFLIPLILLITANIFALYDDGIWRRFVLGDYGIYGIALILGFYVAYVSTPFVTESVKTYNATANSGIDNEIYTQKMRNTLGCISLLFVNVVWYILAVTISDFPFNPFQTYSIFTGLLILMYNGQKGNQPLWFKWLYYIYYPAHLAILVLISFLI
jgi:hypothetical protein